MHSQLILTNSEKGFLPKVKSISEQSNLLKAGDVAYILLIF